MHTIDATKLPPKQAALKALINNGMSIKDAAQHLGYTYNSARALISQKKLTKYKFSDDRISQKIAHRTIAAIAKGVPPAGSTIESIKDSTALTAAQYIHDRLEPAIKVNANLNVSIAIDPVDLSCYTDAPQHIDNDTDTLDIPSGNTTDGSQITE